MFPILATDLLLASLALSIRVAREAREAMAAHRQELPTEAQIPASET